MKNKKQKKINEYLAYTSQLNKICFGEKFVCKPNYAKWELWKKNFKPTGIPQNLSFAYKVLLSVFR